MMVLTAEQIRSLAPLPRLINCLRGAFRQPIEAPPRQILPLPGGSGGRLLLSMPAFYPDGYGVIKLATVSPDNPALGLPTIQGVIVVFSADGAPRAILDGAVVTRLRTGAASALASSYLSRVESRHLALIGTGALAPDMAAAHCAVRPIKRISICGRSTEGIAATLSAVRNVVGRDIELVATTSTASAVADADIVCCATSSPTPVLSGAWLRPGTFVDLVGSFSPSTREADDEAIARSRIFVDTLDGALAEAGDLLDPLARGVIGHRHIEGELADLVCGRLRGRSSDDELTLFKSVGTAIEDLAAARLIVDAMERR